MSLALPSRRWSWAACDLKIEQLQKTNQTLDKQIQDLLLNKEDVTRQIELERQERDIAVLEHAILKLRSDTVKSKNQLEEIRVELRAKIEGNNELNEALNQQKHKFEEIGGTEIELVSESGSTETEQGSCLPDKSLFLVNTFVKDLEQERNFYKAEVDYLLKMLRNKSCGQSNPSRGRSPVHSPPVKGGSYESELICIIKERDDLQNMLNKYERHMAEIQSNVKVLTAERDQNKLFFEQAQEELDRLHRDGVKAPRCPKNSLTAQDILRRLECERDEAAADLRRMITERDSLRERLKISQEAAINERAHLEQRIEDLKSSLHSLESERLEHRSRLTCLKDSVTSLEEEVKILARKSADTEDELCRQRSENNQIRLLMDQTEDTLGETQRRLSLKCTDLQLAQDKNARLCEKNDELNRQIACHQEELNSIRSDAYDFDKQKNCLQELVDEKTETITSLEESLHQKKKIIIDHEINLNELESTVEQLNETVNSKDNEICNLKRQCDALNSEIAEMSRLRDSTCRESNHLHEQLSKIKYDSQGANRKLEESTQEIKELKIKVQDYITEVSKVENLLNAKETENFNLMEQYRRANSQVETWELKGRQMEGENNSLQLELTSFKAENRRMCERLQSLEKEIEEQEAARNAYKAQVCSLNKLIVKVENELRQVQCEKSSVLTDLTTTQELCLKLDSNKEMMMRQVSTKNKEMEQVLSEHESARSEIELLRNQLASERTAIKNLESLLASNREKKYQSQMATQEKEAEIQLFKDKLSLAESKLTSQSREMAQLRSKAAMLESELEMAKRQLGTERFERQVECAVQELRRHGPSYRCSSPPQPSLSPILHSTERSSRRSPDCSLNRSLNRASSLKEF
ncbi:testis-specific gene 10 protein isoform X1 [Callorhinchus milii]|uniref:testis-specific gene 10 protein isoform X1 n=1 Tax=Callorhinchus milii TaxID=7868 RepID=UPI0004571A80|nr:testis-specific gene 10 protein isoform X1 [Callorhinchus milii]|eukprot:gi/632947975/ref/XP_007889340.1/ PREDICTED: testis-specific gene 10 protein isoform X1 [Callorhinchus milii]